ncbi:MAG TPA: SufD family Fe-S cluster assembly protein, partial [Candidatus Kapabacteria bacterium]|nr:SufD family Fe-S cluster assembly protein [Candidatus Kapabacteria bacterium]
MKEDFFNQINDSFVEFSKRTNGKFPAKLKTIRNNAFNSFNSLGFPTKKNEEWKYTDTSFLYKQDFQLQSQKEIENKEITDILKFLINGKKDNIVVLINGRFSKELSRINTEAEKIKIGSLADAMVYKASTIEKHFAQYANYENDAFVALNTMFASDGCYIRTAEGVIVENPIQIVYINTAIDYAPIIQPRNLIILGDCSQIKLYETYHTIGEQAVFQNTVTEVFMKRFANFEHYKIQFNNENSYYIDTTQVHQKRASNYTNNTIS